MTDDAADSLYRTVIDRLVRDCLEGQGQIGPRRARAGLWNANATTDFLPEQHALNVLLATMTSGDREVLARLLAEEFRAGVSAALVALHDLQVPPFEKAYEGTPLHDFVGRVDDWQWPTKSTRW